MGVDRAAAVDALVQHAGMQAALDRRRAIAVDAREIGEAEDADVRRGHDGIVHRRGRDGETLAVDAQRDVAAGGGEEAARDQIAAQTTTISRSDLAIIIGRPRVAD